MRLISIVFILLCNVSAFAAERLAPSLSEQAKIVASSKGADVLYSIHKSSLDENGFWLRQSYISVRINDIDAARDYGRIVIPFDHYYGNTELDFANVLSNGKKLNTVAKDAIQLRVLNSGQDFYDDRSEIAFSLPNVAPGSIIEFQFRSKTKKKAIQEIDSDHNRPHWFQQKISKDGWRTDSVSNYEYQLNVPQTTKMNTKVYGSLPKKPLLTKMGSRLVSTWKWKNIPAVFLEGGMPPLHTMMPSIRSSTSTDWSVVNDWTWKKIKPKLKTTARIKAVLKQLPVDKNSPELEKIKAVFEYLQSNIRYVYSHLGRGGYDPHTPNEVLEQSYGDCKDQTVLGLALLKALNVEAYPALIQTSRSGKADTSLVRLIFDHMLIWVPPTDVRSEIWMDTTGDRSLFPGASQRLLDQTALIINDYGGVLKKAIIHSSPNIGTLELVYSVDKQKRPVVTVKMLFSGLSEENTRRWWKHDNNRSTSLNALMNLVFNNIGQYTVSSKLLYAEDFQQPVEIHGTYTFNAPKDDSKPISLAVSFGQLFRLFGGVGSMQIPESRKMPYISVHHEEMKLLARFIAPDNTLPVVIQSSEGQQSPFFKLEQKGYVDGKDYVVEMNYKSPGINVSAEEYADLYKSLTDLAAVPAWVVSMKPDEQQQELSDLAVIQKNKGKKSAEYQLKLAKNHINNGNFDKALKISKVAVELNIKSGEAWYLLGMAQGLTGLIDESTQSFNKAKSLGYLP